MNISELIESLKLLGTLQVAKPLIIIFVIWSIGFIKVKDKEGKSDSLWARLLKKAGEDINFKVFEEIKKVDNKLDKHIEDENLEKAKKCRQRILRFSDEIYQGRLHSKEHYEDIIDDIDLYEEFCKAHPDFPNNKALLAIENIKETYKENLDSHSFILGDN